MKKKLITLSVLGTLLFTQPCFAGDEASPLKWQPGRGHIPEDNSADVIAEDVMAQRVRDEFANNHKLIKASENKHIVVFFGQYWRW